MKRNIYLAVITIVTILLIFVGVVWHLAPAFGYSLPWDRSEGSERSKETVAQVWEEGDLGECASISISVDAADIILKKGDQCSIQYKGNQQFLPAVKSANGRWVIEQKTKRIVFFGIHDLSDNQLLITLPEGMVPQSVEIDADAGDIDFTDIQLEQVRIKADAGDIDFERADVQDLEIDTDAGDIDVIDTKIERGRIMTDAGDLKMKNVSFTDLSGELDVGSVEINSSTGLDDADLDLSVDLGDIRINKQKQDKRYQQQGSSGISLAMSVDMGDIKISW